jgi:hypothetical protein
VPIARNHISRFVSLSIIANARAARIVPGLSDDLVDLPPEAAARAHGRPAQIAAGRRRRAAGRMAIRTSQNGGESAGFQGSGGPLELKGTADGEGT